jgi:hypothetical protein
MGKRGLKELEIAVLEFLKEYGPQTFYRLEMVMRVRGYKDGLEVARRLNSLYYRSLIKLDREHGHTYYSISDLGSKELRKK